MTNKISEITRRKIFDHLALAKIKWWGRLDDVSFLSRLYNLRELPSHDLRYSDAEGDIHTHRLSFSDWEDDWVFTDSRFKLMHGDDSILLSFLAEIIHPAVRPVAAQAHTIAIGLNKYLRVDGWELIVTDEVSGHPIFTAQAVDARPTVAPDVTGWKLVNRQLGEAHLRFNSAQTEEQFQAVGLLCREVLISAAQECFVHERHIAACDTDPSPTDATRMLSAIFSTELAGSSNEEARAHGKAALKLALALQHRRTATRQMAALCFEATTSVVKLLAILMEKTEAPE